MKNTPFLRAVDGGLSDEDWTRLRDLKAARDALIKEYEGLPPEPLCGPIVECDEWVIERLAHVIQAALDGHFSPMTAADVDWLKDLSQADRASLAEKVERPDRVTFDDEGAIHRLIIGDVLLKRTTKGSWYLEIASGDEHYQVWLHREGKRRVEAVMEPGAIARLQGEAGAA